MTNEALDLLDQLSNPTNIKQAEIDKDRPGWRPALQHFRADILGRAEDIQIETRRPAGSNYDDTGYWLDIDVREILRGRGELGEQKLWIKFPRFPSGDYPDKDSDSENARMMLSAFESDPKILSPRHLPGRKNVEFKEETYDYSYYSSKKGNVDAVTWFYRLNFQSGGAVANGNTAVATAKPSDAAIAKALDMIKSAGADGIREAEFNLAASKDPVIKADKAMLGYLHSGKLVGDNPDKVLRDGEKLVWVAAE